MAEEAQAELLAEAVGGGLPFVDASEQALAPRLQLRGRIDLQEVLERAVETLVAEVAEEVDEPLRVIAQAENLERDRAWIRFVADQEVQHRQPLRPRHIARAVGDDRVREPQQP